MRRVAQRTATDCGIAAAAIIADVSYEDARAAFKRFPGRGFGTHAKDVRHALNSLGVRLGKQPRNLRGFRTLDLEFDALVMVLLNEGRRTDVRHWIVWNADERRFLDPDRKNPRVTYRFDRCFKVRRPVGTATPVASRKTQRQDPSPSRTRQGRSRSHEQSAKTRPRPIGASRRG